VMFAADRSPPAGRNVDYYKDDTLTKMLYASDRTVDRAKRTALLRAAQRRIAEMAVEIPLYNTAKVDAVPASLENFKGNPTNAGPFWNVHEWEIRAKP
jgi:peptide/nickel transport system substrate-binding protein